jgi:malonyl-CoA O-methyltransferase
MHHSAIKTCFDRAAKTYDASSLVQQQVGGRLIGLLKNIRCEFNKALDLGCGSGLTTQLLMNTMTFNSMTAIDISNNLIEIAQERLTQPNIHLKIANYDELETIDPFFDLIFSNMSLQWSDDFNLLLKKISNHLLSSGVFAFSIPVVGTFCELQSISRNEYYTHQEVIASLREAGFICVKVLTEEYVNQYDSAFAALKAIKAMGANFLLNKTVQSLQSKRYIDRLYMPVHTVPTLTYQVGFYIARRG